MKDKEINEITEDSLSKDYLAEVASLLYISAQKEFSVYVVYRSRCTDDYHHLILLDRYPMEPIIHDYCPVHTDRLCLCDLSAPIIFYTKFDDTYYQLADMADIHITESPQKPFLEAYQKETQEQIIK